MSARLERIARAHERRRAHNYARGIPDALDKHMQSTPRGVGFDGWYGDQHAGKDAAGGLGLGLVPTAAAARGEAFGGFYQGHHAGRDVKDSLGPGMVPTAAAARGEAFAGWYSEGQMEAAAHKTPAFQRPPANSPPPRSRSRPDDQLEQKPMAVAASKPHHKNQSGRSNSSSRDEELAAAYEQIRRLQDLVNYLNEELRIERGD